MKNVENKLKDAGIVPVIKIADASLSQAAGLAAAIEAGGILAAEVTFRTAVAAEAIYKMREACPDMLIGAGTVLSKASLDAAISAGAQFIVSPGLNPAIVEEALSRNVPAIPGCMTPSEIERAISLGLDFVKFFPAEAAGGVGFLKAVSAPYAGVRFMPTGGITLQNAAEYLSLPCVVCCGASFIAGESQISEGRFDEITASASLAKRISEAAAKKHNI